MLNITPNEILTFPQTGNSEAIISLCCNSVVPLIFKIQTTSPEKFRVRPRHGLLEPRQTVNINIMLRSDHRLAETTRDKFLILSMPAPLDRDLATPQNIADIWKQRPINSPTVDQHRLTCVYQNEGEGFRNVDGSSEHDNNRNFIGGKGNGNNNNTGITNSFRPNQSNLNELTEQTHKLEKQLKFTQFMQYVTLFMLLLMSVAVVYLLRLEMDFGFLSLANGTWSYRGSAQAHNQERLPLRTRLSHSFPKMGRLSRGSR